MRKGNLFRRVPPLDAATAGVAYERPGNDTREWISFGTVATDTDGGDAVIFHEADGQVYVRVTLHPSLRPAMCRVGAQVAGNGEADYTPFVPGDEVLVALPQGREDAGATIICRLNNSLDAFPMDSIAGQDPTGNNFAFSRRRTPMIHEYAGPVTFRSAITGAFFSIDKAGVVMFKSGTNSVLQMSPDGLAYQGESSSTSPPKFMLQLLETQGQFIVQVDDAYFQLSSSSASAEVNIINVPGPLALGTAGNAPLEHVTTTEAVANILCALGTVVGVPWTPANVAAALAAASIAPLPAPIVAALVAAFGTPVTPGTQLVKPLVPGNPVQMAPGIGCVGLTAG